MAWEEYMNEVDQGHAPEEQHSFEFRGQWLPAHICYLAYVKKKLSRTDLAVLCMVDAFTKHGGKGCYASNGYLARMLRVTVRQVRRSIDILVKMKLVIRTLEGEKRTLLCVHSRHPQERAGGEDNFVLGGRTKKSTNADMNVPHNHKSNIRREMSGDFSVPRQLEIPSESGKPTRFSTSIATILWKFSTKKGYRNNKSQFHKWEQEIEKLTTEVGKPAIKKSLQWYIHNYDKQYVPEIYSAKSFREKFNKLKAAMKREEKGQPKAAKQSPASDPGYSDWSLR